MNLCGDNLYKKQDIFTGSPRPFGPGPDASGYNMMYGSMQHSTSSPGDYYSRAQTGKSAHKNQSIQYQICVLQNISKKKNIAPKNVFFKEITNTNRTSYEKKCQKNPESSINSFSFQCFVLRLIYFFYCFTHLNSKCSESFLKFA